jgi:hypothetical protein
MRFWSDKPAGIREEPLMIIEIIESRKIEKAIGI